MQSSQRCPVISVKVPEVRYRASDLAHSVPGNIDGLGKGQRGTRGTSEIRCFCKYG